MARKMIYISDVTQREIDEGDVVKISLAYADARRGYWTLDAHPEDDIVRTLVERGHKQARRGRKPQQAAEASQRQ